MPCAYLQRTVFHPNASQASVDATIKALENAKDNLKIATVGIYSVTIDRKQISNHHVGDSWSFSCTKDGKAYKNATQFQAALNSTESFIFTIKDNDNVPDIGTAYLDITLSDGYTCNTRISVTENRGQYAGNTAEWELEITVSLLRTISTDEADANIQFDYIIESVINTPVVLYLHPNNDNYMTQTIQILSNEKYELPILENYDDCLFCGWYKDSTFTTPITDEPISGINHLYAKWLKTSNIEYKSNELSSVEVGATEKTVSMIVTQTGRYTMRFYTPNYFTGADILITNKSTQKVLYNGLLIGSKTDNSVSFTANSGDEIELVLEGFDVAEFHGYVFNFNAVYETGTKENKIIVSSYSRNEKSKVLYGNDYSLTPITINGYSFIGYYTVDGAKMTDEHGNSIVSYNILGNIKLYAKYDINIE